MTPVCSLFFLEVNRVANSNPHAEQKKKKDTFSQQYCYMTLEVLEYGAQVILTELFGTFLMETTKLL